MLPIQPHRSTQRQGDKRSAPQGYLLRGTAADLIASKNLLREGAHKVRPASSKTLPRGSNGGRSSLGLSFFHIFLQTKKDMVPRSKCPWGATGGRPPPNAAGKHVKPKLPTTEQKIRPAALRAASPLLIPFSALPPDPSSPPSLRESTPQSSSILPKSKRGSRRHLRAASPHSRSPPNGG